MKLLVIQNKVYETIEENIQHLSSLMDNIPMEDLDVIVFPEMFTTPYELKYFQINQQDSDGQVIHFLKHVAKKHSAYVIGGSVPENEKGALYNTSYILNRKGQIISKYRKIHLFSVTYPNGKTFRESDVLSSGNQLSIIETEMGKIGIIICFDIRFPELIKKYRMAGCHTLIVPGAFNTYTGPMHWQTTFKARAIDNQIFMVGASPANDSFGDYEPYGHSIAIDPYGKIIEELDDTEGYFIIDIDSSFINEPINRIPIIKNEINLDDIS
jgi:predicted amidohydrolase